jgi:hypothetical protein
MFMGSVNIWMTMGHHPIFTDMYASRFMHLFDPEGK